MEWYPRNPVTFDLGTLGFTLAERGAYSGLIDAYYANEGPLPDDDGQLAALLRVAVDDWLAVAPKVRTKFSVIDGKLHHDICDAELEKQHRLASISRENGKGGGRPKGSKNKNKKLTKPSNNQSDTQPPPQKKPQTYTTDIEEGGGGTREPSKFWSADLEAGRMVEWFERRRLELWPTESALPAPRLTQLSLIRGYIDQGISAAALTELIERQMAGRATNGQNAPNSIKAFHRSLAEGVGQWIAAQKSPHIATVTPGASHGQRSSRPTGHTAFADAAARFIARETGLDPRTGAPVGGVADDGRAVRSGGAVVGADEDASKYPHQRH